MACAWACARPSLCLGLCPCRAPRRWRLWQLILKASAWLIVHGRRVLGRGSTTVCRHIHWVFGEAGGVLLLRVQAGGQARSVPSGWFFSFPSTLNLLVYLLTCCSPGVSALALPSGPPLPRWGTWDLFPLSIPLPSPPLHLLLVPGTMWDTRQKNSLTPNRSNNNFHQPVKYRSEL